MNRCIDVCLGCMGHTSNCIAVNSELHTLLVGSEKTVKPHDGSNISKLTKWLNMYGVYILPLMAQFEFPAKITSNGRVTIPKRFRDKFDIDEGDSVDVEVQIDE